MYVLVTALTVFIVCHRDGGVGGNNNSSTSISTTRSRGSDGGCAQFPVYGGLCRIEHVTRVPLHADAMKRTKFGAAYILYTTN